MNLSLDRKRFVNTLMDGLREATYVMWLRSAPAWTATMRLREGERMVRLAARLALFAMVVGLLAFPMGSAAQTAPDLRKPAGREWSVIGGDWSNSRYSTLTQITPDNVGNLKGAWV